MDDRILSLAPGEPHPVQARRKALGWSQGDLAAAAGIPRSTVSAIEGRRLTPSVHTALLLARALGQPVERLFAPDAASPPPTWAWEPISPRARFWRAEVAGRTWLFPAETTHGCAVPHDGVADGDQRHERDGADPTSTLVLAGCDPAMGLLAQSLAAASGFRVLTFHRSGADALDLLATGRVHLAAIHRSTPEDPDRNAEAVRSRVGSACRLLRLADWEEGIALPRHSRRRSAASCRRGVQRWAVRERGSAARECLEELLGRPVADDHAWRSHAAVAEAVQQGSAEAGICVRLCAEETGLAFVPVRTESLDLCFPAALEDDPRVLALVRLVQSRAHRQRLADLPGYDVTRTGALASVDPT
jgi:molybdate-binding protein/transcriptional regulator with XRE-family HTH domain